MTMTKMKFSKLLAAALLAFGLATAPAHAANVTWTINYVYFGDGAQVYGQFTYNADTGQFSNWLINTYSAGAGNNGAIYSPIFGETTGVDATYNALTVNTPVGATGTYLSIADNVTVDLLFLAFSGPLTNAGGTLSVLGGYEAKFYDGFYAEVDGIGTGTITARSSIAAVPLPPMLPIFVAALAAMAFFGMRKAGRQG
jgi:hypothetical protein